MVLKSFGQYTDQEEVEMMMKGADTDKDGFLDIQGRIESIESIKF